MADRHAKVSNACLDALEGLPHTFPPYSYDEHSSEVIHSTGIEESGQRYIFKVFSLSSGEKISAGVRARMQRAPS